MQNYLNLNPTLLQLLVSPLLLSSPPLLHFLLLPLTSCFVTSLLRPRLTVTLLRAHIGTSDIQFRYLVATTKLYLIYPNDSHLSALLRSCPPSPLRITSVSVDSIPITSLIHFAHSTVWIASGCPKPSSQKFRLQTSCTSVVLKALAANNPTCPLGIQHPAHPQLSQLLQHLVEISRRVRDESAKYHCFSDAQRYLG